MENREISHFLMHDTQSLAFQEQILDAQGHEAEELPEIFLDFWQDWYHVSQEHCHDFHKLLKLLEELLFRSTDELLIHDLSNSLCRALRFWQLQVKRRSIKDIRTSQPRKQPRNSDNLIAKVSLKVLIETWEIFQKSFVPRLGQYKSILVKALAVPYSFSGLAIIKSIDKEALQKQSAISLYSSISTQIHSQLNPQDSTIEHSWAIDLLTAKFQKTIGLLAQAEKLLQNLTRNLQPSLHNAISSSALFELCDIYSQMEQDKLFYYSIRKLLLQNPVYWDFALVGSQFCTQLLQTLPYHIRNQFHSNDPIALNWAGLYALANGEYGLGTRLSHQQQKSYWAQIIQLKKTISDQKISSKQLENWNLRGDLGETLGTTKPTGETTSGGEFYTLQRAQLLVYYILILEHLHWDLAPENPSQALEENSILWQNVMIEIYSLSEDISQRCKNRFYREGL